MIEKDPSTCSTSGPAWVDGAFLGAPRTSNADAIGISTGVIRAHSIKRRPEEEAWGGDDIEASNGTQPKPMQSRSGFKIPTGVADELDSEEYGDDAVVGSVVIAHEDAGLELDTFELPHAKTLALSVFADDIAKYDMSTNCRGCSGREKNWERFVAHSSGSRNRSMEHILQDWDFEDRVGQTTKKEIENNGLEGEFGSW